MKLNRLFILALAALALTMPSAVHAMPTTLRYGAPLAPNFAVPYEVNTDAINLELFYEFLNTLGW